MAIYVKNNNDFELGQPIVRECPHCGAYAPMVPVATPGFAELNEARPQHAGVAFRCAACNEPRFARAAVRSFGDDRIILSTNLVEVERPKEHFQYNYLPQRMGRLLREAFGCYAADLRLGFVLLCRRLLQSDETDEASAQTFEAQFEDTCASAAIGPESRELLLGALFGQDDIDIDADQAAILVEVVKDMLYQRYIRTAKLKRAIEMRRFFAAEADRKVTPIASLSARSQSS